MLTTYTNALSPSIILNPGMFISVNGATAWFDGALQTIAPSFLALSPNTTSYIFLNTVTGTIQLNQTGFTATVFPVATATTSSSQITSLVDNRPDWIIGGTGGGGGGGASSIEVPSGAVNSANTVFTIAAVPNPTSSLLVFRNGLQLKAGLSYSLAGSTITFVSAPLTGDVLQVYYSSSGSGGGGGGFNNNDIVPTGAINGSNTVFTLPATPTPAASLMLFLNGILQQPGGVDYTLSGSTITYVLAPLVGDTHVCWFTTSVGGGGGGPNFSDNETPSGTINGINTTFTLVFTPNPAASLELFRNGQLQQPGGDYNLSGNTIIFTDLTIPLPGDNLQAFYRH